MRFLLLALLLAYTSATHAQALPAMLSLRPSSLAAAPPPGVAPRDPALRLQPIDLELYAAQRRGRLLLASGVSMLASVAAFTAVVHNTRCEPLRRGAMVGMSVVGSVGLTLSVLGGVRLAHGKREGRYPPTRGQKIALAFTALGSALAGATFQGATALMGSPGCSS